MNNNKLEILVTAKDAASNVIQGVGKSFGQLSDNAVTGSKMMLGATLAATAGVAAFGKSSVDAYFAAAEASAKLSTNILNVKGNTMGQVDALEQLASKMQSYGVIEDDAIKAGMSQLATFNLQSSTIGTLTPKIADMVAQMKGHNATAEDMVGVNNLVGKVMTGNVGALSRYGVTLNDTQAEMIKNGTEAQRAATLVEVLGQNYGEVNKKLRQTPQGIITGLKNDFGDLQEGVGEFIIMGLQPLFTGFSNWIAKVNEAGGFLDYFSGLIRNNMDTVKMLAGALIAVLIPAIVSLVISAAPVTLTILALAAAGALLAKGADILAKKFGGWGKVMSTVKGWLSDAKLAVEVFISAFKDPDITSDGWVGKIEEIAGGARAAFEGLKSAAVAVWGAIKMAIDFLMPSLTALWNTISTNLLPTLMRLWNFIEPAIIPTLKVLGIIIGVVLVGAIWVAINVLNIIINVVSWFINVLIEVVQRVIWFGTMVVQYIQFVYNFWKTIFEAIYAVVTWLVNAAIAYFTFWINTVKAIIGGIIGIFQWAFSTAWNVVTGIWNGIGGFFSNVVGRIGSALGGIYNTMISPFQRAFDFIKDIPGRIVGAIGNVGNLLRDKLGDFDIPGPLGKVRDVIPGFATGGFTGRGGKYDVAGLVHKGEYVVPKEQVDQSTGLPMIGGGGGFHLEVHGNVVNETPEAAKAWWGEMARMGELAEQGVPL